jgi:hypothetical protein
MVHTALHLMLVCLFLAIGVLNISSFFSGKHRSLDPMLSALFLFLAVAFGVYAFDLDATLALIDTLMDSILAIICLIYIIINVKKNFKIKR